MLHCKKNCIFVAQMEDLWKNSARLLSANVLTQAIGILIYPVLTRLYAPDDFGLFNLFLSIGGVLALLSTAEYQYAIVLPKKEDRARALFQVGGMVLLAVTALTVLTIPFARPLASLFNASALAQWYWLLPFYVFAMGLWTLLNYYYIRGKMFRRVSRFQVVQSSLAAGAKTGLGVAGCTGGGLIVGSVVAFGAAVVVNVCAAGKKVLGGLFQVDRHACREAAREYANFPKFSLPRALVNNLGGNLPALLLTPFFGLSEAGFFGMAVSLGFRPLNMISTSLYQTFYQQTAAAVNGGRSVWSLLRKFVCSTLSIAVPVFVGLYFVLPALMEWLLGSEWVTVAQCLRWMMPWLLMSLLVAPICYLSDVFGKQKIGLLFEVVLLVARVVGIAVGIAAQDFVWAVAGYSLGGAVVIGCQLVWLLSLVKDYERSISR